MGNKGILIGLLAAGCLVPAAQVHALPLHYAAYRGDLEAVEYLVSQGAGVNSKDSSGVAPLHYAASMGHMEVVEYLARHGADVDIRSSREGNSPLHLASGSGHMDAVRFLLDSGADTDCANDDGDTPLHWAVGNGRIEVVEFLLGRGADIDAADHAGMTSLHLAVTRGYDTIVCILLDEGADPGRRAGDGTSPMRSALRGGFVRIARLLRLGGADLRTRDELVRFVQGQLWLRGYGIVEMDGVVRPDTEAAVRAYQRQAALAEDGAATYALADHLAASGEIDAYLPGERATVTNIYVRWDYLAYKHGWETELAWSQGKLVGGGTSSADPDFRGYLRYEGHVKFGNLAIIGSVWVLPGGWLIGHGSTVHLHGATAEDVPR